MKSRKFIDYSNTELIDKVCEIVDANSKDYLTIFNLRYAITEKMKQFDGIKKNPHLIISDNYQDFSVKCKIIKNEHKRLSRLLNVLDRYIKIKFNLGV